MSSTKALYRERIEGLRKYMKDEEVDTPPDEQPENITGMKGEMVRKLRELFLINYLKTEDPRVIGLFERKVRVVGLMKMASTLAFTANARLPGIIENLLNIVRQNLLANADQLIKLLSI